MSSSTTGSAALPPDPSVEAVGRELRRSRWTLSFAPAIERRFEHSRRAARRRELVLAGLLALAIYDLFLISDALVRPEMLQAAMVWRLGVVTLYGLLALALTSRGVSARWSERAVASTVVVATYASSEIFAHTTSAAGVYDPFVFSLLFMAGNLALSLGFVQSLASSVVSMAIVAYFVLTKPGMPSEPKPFVLGLLFGTAAFTILACYRLEKAMRRSYLLVLREELRSQSALHTADLYAVLSQTDALTLLANRRGFELAVERYGREARLAEVPLALLMVDLDNFKRFNDRYGHPAGDRCLRAVAAALRSSVRDTDFVARIGGEEFVVLLQPTSRELAVQAGERLRAAVEQLAVPHDGVDGQRVVTISVGAAVTSASDESVDGAALLAEADGALYEAKRSGRNRVVLASGRNVEPRAKVA